MASIENSKYYFPHFPLPPPHYPSPNLTPPPSPPPPKGAPPHNSPPPPKVAPPHNAPFPPKVAPSYNAPPPPKVAPPHNPITPPPVPVPVTPQPPAAKPPSHSNLPPSPTVKPPPHPLPPLSPPHILPPPPAPAHLSTVIVIVFVSLGGLFFLAFLSVALCCFIKRKKKRVHKTEILSIDEHVKVQEAIIPGPHGEQAVLISIEEDVHINEEIKKNDKENGVYSNKPSQGHPQAVDVKTTSSGSSGSSHHHLQHKA